MTGAAFALGMALAAGLSAEAVDLALQPTLP
jgi:hypothetical protein